jgi:hypothetical protein
MKYNFSYEIVQIGTETKNRIENVVTEIRFFHCLNNEHKRLYVVHLTYENMNQDNYVLYPQVKREGNEILYPWIESTLGSEQIQHMKNLLIEDSKATKQYIDV